MMITEASSFRAITDTAVSVGYGSESALTSSIAAGTLLIPARPVHQKNTVSKILKVIQVKERAVKCDTRKS